MGHPAPVFVIGAGAGSFGVRSKPVVAQAVKNSVAVAIASSDLPHFVRSVGCSPCMIGLRYGLARFDKGLVRTFFPDITEYTFCEAPENELQDVK